MSGLLNLRLILISFGLLSFVALLQLLPLELIIALRVATRVLFLVTIFLGALVFLIRQLRIATQQPSLLPLQVLDKTMLLFTASQSVIFILHGLDTYLDKFDASFYYSTSLYGWGALETAKINLYGHLAICGVFTLAWVHINRAQHILKLLEHRENGQYTHPVLLEANSSWKNGSKVGESCLRLVLVLLLIAAQLWLNGTALNGTLHPSSAGLLDDFSRDFSEALSSDLLRASLVIGLLSLAFLAWDALAFLNLRVSQSQKALHFVRRASRIHATTLFAAVVLVGIYLFLTNDRAIKSTADDSSSTPIILLLASIFTLAILIAATTGIWQLFTKDSLAAPRSGD